MNEGKIENTSRFLKDQGFESPEIGIILGTGLGKLIERIQIIKEIHYSEIPDFPVSTVDFHKGSLIYGIMSGRKIVAMHGRFHFYEGYTLQQITFPVRVMKVLGIKHLLVSNACGAVNPEFKKGTIMLLDDHINLLGYSPLSGPNLENFGPRFPDMSQPYSKSLNDKITRIAKKCKIILHEGIYVAVPGPNLETRAEYRFLRRIGADVVGMSTVPEVIVANHMNLPCAAISVITDECDPDNLMPVDIKDILRMASIAEEGLATIFTELVKEL
ncbi:MAG: purine-nucleoside phosphorylase [Bacteroidales bacterium]|nr:purine-nucleoside phosphorylase [Bacteroidales bacterium]